MIKNCKRCESPLSPTTIIHGKTKDIRSRKYCLVCSPWRKHNKRHLEKRKLIDGVEHKLCPQCKLFKPTAIDFYSYSAGACKSCATQMVIRRRQSNKMRAVAYKGGHCLDCGGVFQACVYDFHHIDPTQKDFTIGCEDGASWARIKVELDKCVLLCSNCHRVRHSPSRTQSP